MGPHQIYHLTIRLIAAHRRGDVAAVDQLHKQVVECPQHSGDMLAFALATLDASAKANCTRLRAGLQTACTQHGVDPMKWLEVLRQVRIEFLYQRLQTAGFSGNSESVLKVLAEFDRLTEPPVEVKVSESPKESPVAK